METTKNTDVIKYVSTLLNDQYPGNEFVRWPEKLVREALSEALGVIALFRPDLAIAVVDMELVVGAVQTAPEGCSKISSVLGQVDPETGAVMEMAEEADNELAKWFPVVCGSDSSEYKLGSYSMSASNGRIIIVHPPVKPGQEGTIKVQCVGGCGDADVDCQFNAPVVEYMMYRLLGQEDDSQTSAAASRAHLSTFSNMLALNLRMVQNQLEGRPNAPAAQPNEAG